MHFINKNMQEQIFIIYGILLFLKLFIIIYYLLLLH